MNHAFLPRLLVIDDLFGRECPGSPNRERRSLCGKFLLLDETATGSDSSALIEIVTPTARALFFRGQSPEVSGVGTVVENDLVRSLQKVREGWTVAMAEGKPPWAMVLLDLCFYTGRVTEESNRRTPGMPKGRPGDDDPRSYFGLALLDAIHREFPELPVFVLSSKPREDVSLEFSHRGALGFIDRSDPRGPELLQEALWNHGLLSDPDGEVVGSSLPVLLALREARRAAGHRENVFIRGERGTGKELMAHYLHRMASRDQTDRPFVTVNSAIFTPNLFASELFGIQPRTATGVDGKIGLIESAGTGDLFLDEIADMPPEVQAAILRVLQERQITRVGGREPVAVGARFLSATNVDLEDEARGFRSDLLDRLRLGGSVWVPPLRERTIDIPLLVERFVREAESQRAGIRRREVTPEAMSVLQRHEWPGNIRELRSVVFDAVTRFPDVEHLVKSHLRMSARKTKEKADTRKGSAPAVTAVSESLDGLMTQMANTIVDARNVEAWAGKLDKLQSEYARLVARILQAALDATKRRTPRVPEGQIQIHPAGKLLTGDPSLTASKAADVIKRLLGPLEGELEGELLEAYRTAVRLRPKSARSSSARNK